MNRTSKKAVFLLIFLLFGQILSAETIARVAKATGDVFVKRLGTTQFNEAVAPGAAINNGDALKVGKTGFAVVIFIDDRSVIKVKSNTEFQFIDTENTRSIDINAGTIINHVAKQGRNKTYRVETPTSVASVKGTIFSAIIDASGVDQFFGTEGVVEVFNVISGQTVNLTAGMKAISNALGSLVQAPAAPNEYPTDPETGEAPAPENESQPEGGQTEEAPAEEPTTEEAPTTETEEVPESQPESTPPEQPEAPPVPEDQGAGPAEKPFGMGLGIGSVTIDGVIYNQLAFRPEFKFGKLGVGLDLVIYIDNEGNIRTDEWDFKQNPGQILDKVLYVRWGQKGDPFWAKWGALENVTLGYGGLVSGYSNMMEFPTIRRIGVNTGIQIKNIGAELFFANIKDFSRGGTLMGLRGTYRVSKAFPLTVGANFVIDMNQFSGLKDQDKDTYPDIFDDFPNNKHLWNDTDGDGIPDPHPGLDSSKVDIDADGDNIYDPIDPSVVLKADPFSTLDNK
ncbi:MAG: FecR domain-containing protein, partial [Fidelibacterota bacterium]